MSLSEQAVRTVDNRSNDDHQIIKRTTTEIDNMTNIKKNVYLHPPDIVPQEIGAELLTTATTVEIIEKINKIDALLKHIKWGY